MRPIILAPRSGESPENLGPFIETLAKEFPGRKIFGYEYTENVDVNEYTNCSIRMFFNSHPDLQDATLIAFGGFGAYIGYNMMRLYSNRITTAYFAGGAPGRNLMPGVRFRLWLDSMMPHRSRKIYHAQLHTVRDWLPFSDWHVAKNCRAFYIPDRTLYDTEKAAKDWRNFGVEQTGADTHILFESLKLYEH